MSGTATTTSAPSHSHNVPSNPKLQLDFKVVRKGRCRSPTGQRRSTSTSSWSQRSTFAGSRRELDDLYPTERGQVGNSQLLIRTGWCQYDIDVMRLNYLALVHE